MSTGLVPIDVAISTPTSGQYTSESGQTLGVNYNPAFLVGSGSLTDYLTANPSNSQSQNQNPNMTTPATSVASPGGTPSTPSSAVPGVTGTTTTGSSSLLIWLLIGGALLLVMGGGGKK